MNAQAVYDLHAHSIASDGSLRPAELVRRAAANGVSALALTDHDSTEGLAEAMAAAREVGIRLVPGVEISVTWKGRTVHIVGLNIDRGNKLLQEGLEGLREFRVRRAEAIAGQLDKAGIPGALAGAKHHAVGGLVSRTHFAHFLVENGHAKDVRRVFKHFLVKGKPGHVAGQWCSLADAVGWINAAGGQAVIAHPARYRLTRTKLLELIGDFRAAGGVAMEVVSGSHSRDECLTMAAHARSAGLLASAGSDFHGPENAYVELGRLRELPDGVTPVWADWQ